MVDVAESLFEQFFLPLYPADARDDLARARATDANPGRNATVLSHLDDAAQTFADQSGRLFGSDLSLDGTDESVHRLSAALSPAVRDRWAAAGEPGTADNVLFNAVVHGSAYVGACIVRNHAGVWGVRRPLWESVVRLVSRAGEGDLPIFHWWLKSLVAAQAAGRGATLADRYRTYVEVPCARPEASPLLLTQNRALLRFPRLQKPSYHTLHRYLRAHVPELCDLGPDFPTAARFEAFQLKWLDLLPIGGGAMLLAWGPSPSGLHLIWLAQDGFEKSIFIPCDAFPEPVVRAQGERLVICTREGGRERTHEMLWWGP